VVAELTTTAAAVSRRRADRPPTGIMRRHVTPTIGAGAAASAAVGGDFDARRLRYIVTPLIRRSLSSSSYPVVRRATTLAHLPRSTPSDVFVIIDHGAALSGRCSHPARVHGRRNYLARVANDDDDNNDIN